MKKLLSIGLLILYLPFGSGVLINYRYCNGTIDGIAFFKSVKNCCPNDLIEKNCCKHTSLLEKINTSYDFNGSLLTIQPESTGTIPGFALRNYSASDNLKKSIVDGHQYRLQDKNPIYLINRVFII
jgi:hypothetical protein